MRGSTSFLSALALLVPASGCLFGTVDALDSDYGKADARADATRRDATADAHGDVRPDIGREGGIDGGMDAVSDVTLDCSPPVCTGLIECVSGAHHGLYVDDGGIYFTVETADAAPALYAISKSDRCETPHSLLPAGAKGTIWDVIGDDTSLYWIIMESPNAGEVYRAKKPSFGASSVEVTPVRMLSTPTTLSALAVDDGYVYVGSYAATDAEASNTSLLYFNKAIVDASSSSSVASKGAVQQIARADGGVYWTEFGETNYGLQTLHTASANSGVVDGGATVFGSGLALASSGAIYLADIENGRGVIRELPGGGTSRVVTTFPTEGLNSDHQLNGSTGRIFYTNYLALDRSHLYWSSLDSMPEIYSFPLDGGDADTPLGLRGSQVVAPLYPTDGGLYFLTAFGVGKL